MFLLKNIVISFVKLKDKSIHKNHFKIPSLKPCLFDFMIGMFGWKGVSPNITRLRLNAVRSLAYEKTPWNLPQGPITHTYKRPWTATPVTIKVE